MPNQNANLKRALFTNKHKFIQIWSKMYDLKNVNIPFLSLNQSMLVLQPWSKQLPPITGTSLSQIKPFWMNGTGCCRIDCTVHVWAFLDLLVPILRTAFKSQMSDWHQMCRLIIFKWQTALHFFFLYQTIILLWQMFGYTRGRILHTEPLEPSLRFWNKLHVS